MSAPLTLLRLRPDREALAIWAARHKLAPGGADLGYVWHAALKSVFGDLAPQPFVDRLAVQSDEVLGYVQAKPATLIERARSHSEDTLAARAIGLDSVKANDLPEFWHEGRQLSFEVRTRPVVRSRRAPRSGTVDEVDVAPYRAALDQSIGREQAYADWIASQLLREGAATLLSARMHAFRRTRVMRRTGNSDGRRPVQIEGPDAWMRGRLRIDNPGAFDQLLRRGIGRHRAFGFGCLLVAPPGVLE